EIVALADVQVAHVLAFGLARRKRTQRGAAEESDLYILCEAMQAEEPALAIDAVERRIPFDCFAHAGDRALDERVEAVPDVAVPAGHGFDVGLHRSVALAFDNLRIAAGEEDRLCCFVGPRLRRRLARLRRLHSGSLGGRLLHGLRRG